MFIVATRVDNYCCLPWWPQ